MIAELEKRNGNIIAPNDMKQSRTSKKTDALTRNGFRASCSIRCLFRSLEESGNSI